MLNRWVRRFSNSIVPFEGSRYPSTIASFLLSLQNLTIASDCNDSNECTYDVCVDSECTYNDVDCDDGVYCTDDSCDPESGCVNTPDDGLCDDYDPCTTDTCDGSECVNTPIEGCGSGTDDPHFRGFHNQTFELHGYSGNIYNLISQYPQATKKAIVLEILL